jgi:hypothetical protein
MFPLHFSVFQHYFAADGSFLTWADEDMIEMGEFSA